MEMNLNEIINGTNNVVRLIIDAKPANSLFNDICQGIIASVAVLGAIVAFFKRRREVPKLRLNFDDTDLHCHIEEAEIEGGAKSAKNSRILLRIGVENVGSASADGCKVMMNDAIIISGGKAEQKVKTLTPLRYLTLISDERCEKCDQLGSGEIEYFKLGYICAERDSNKGAEGVVAEGSKQACIELHSRSNVPERFLPHQNHIRIPLKLCAGGSSPEEYWIDLNWKGGSVSAIGSVGSLEATLQKGKIRGGVR